MKKSIINSFLCLSVFSSFLLLSCQSSKNTQNIPADDYSTSENAENQIIIEENINLNENQINSSETKLLNAPKKDNNFFTDLFTFGNRDDFIKGDEFTLFTRGVAGGVAQKSATILLSTKNDTVGYGSPYFSVYYITQFDSESRKKIINAVNQYLSDFENKRLDRKGKNSYKKYGKIKIHLDWGTLSSSTPNNGSGEAYVGYGFEKKSPYFMISSFALKNDYYDLVGGSTARESLQLKYFFTKAQAKQLAYLLSDEGLAKYYESFKPVIINENDDYVEE